MRRLLLFAAHGLSVSILGLPFARAHGFGWAIALGIVEGALCGLLMAGAYRSGREARS